MSFTSMSESTRKAPLQCRILLPTIIALLLLLPIVSGSFFEPFNVSYDHRALTIAGKRRMLVSAGVHYPRATPQVKLSEIDWLITIEICVIIFDF